MLRSGGPWRASRCARGAAQGRPAGLGCPRCPGRPGWPAPRTCTASLAMSSRRPPGGTPRRGTGGGKGARGPHRPAPLRPRLARPPRPRAAPSGPSGRRARSREQRSAPGEGAWPGRRAGGAWLWSCMLRSGRGYVNIEAWFDVWACLSLTTPPPPLPRAPSCHTAPHCSAHNFPRSRATLGAPSEGIPANSGLQDPSCGVGPPCMGAF